MTSKIIIRDRIDYFLSAWIDFSKDKNCNFGTSTEIIELS
jgi:hypothetical protein